MSRHEDGPGITSPGDSAPNRPADAHRLQWVTGAAGTLPGARPLTPLPGEMRPAPTAEESHEQRTQIPGRAPRVHWGGARPVMVQSPLPGLLVVPSSTVGTGCAAAGKLASVTVDRWPSGVRAACDGALLVGAR